jgi:diguanylate cyclase (GGDEF)-like protein
MSSGSCHESFKRGRKLPNTEGESLPEEIDVALVTPEDASVIDDVLVNREAARLSRLAALAGVELVGEVSYSDVLERVVDLATELLPTDGGACIVLWDPVDETLELAATTVPGQEPGSVDFRSDGETRRIVDTGEPLVARDPGEIEKQTDFASFVGVPIQGEGRVLGVLYTLDREPRDYRDDDVEFLQVLARRAAAAIVHAQMFEETRMARERSEALAWAANAVIAADDLVEVLQSVVEGVAASVQADRVHLAMVDVANERILNHVVTGSGKEPPASYEQLMAGLTGWVIREGRLAISQGTEADARETQEVQGNRRAIGGGPALVAPLRSGGEILGSLTALRPAGSPMFSEPEVDLVLAMANQTAVAIDNVRLLDTTRSSLREIEAMYTVSQRLIDAETPTEMLQAVADGVAEALGIDRVNVVMVEAEAITEQAVSGDMEPISSFEELRSGLAESTLESSLPSVLPADESRIHCPGAVAVHPLKVHAHLLGVVIAGAPDAAAGDFTAHQLDMLGTLAAQAAVAIENTRLFAEVRRLAVTDELTGLNTRRHLFELGEREFQQAVRYRTPLSAIMFDLDHFKMVNDTLGHVVGDEVLKGVADRCRSVVRAIDVLGRFGGEEFAIVLPQTELEIAVTIAERLREIVGQEPIETSRGPIAVTVSCGVAQMRPGVLELKTLLDQADAAMYEAKRAGRNRVEADR